MKTKLLVAGLLISLLSACQQSARQSEPQLEQSLAFSSRIESLRDNQPLSTAELVNRLSAAPMVIVGEKHDNADHHRIEQWLISQLAAKRPQGSVLMEMIASDQQDAVNQLQQGLKSSPYIRDERLQQLLQWNNGWPWSLYGAVVTTALKGNAPLLAANLSASEVKQIYQTKQMPAGILSSQQPVLDALSTLIVTMHDGQIDADRLASMLAVQQNRDRFMAQQLLAAPKPALLIAGGYHAARNLGVPLHLRDLDKQARPLVLMLAEQGMKITAGQADYVWYVAVVAR
ncbi:iron-regulated protein [Winslowiella iniecta]|uniref:Iron-regulated protein n=1 Tax=Winslowiella iniecta TaxID=1560201 RepID=A0A0L7TG02_9GAMM|nr:iron-regulated protein [Winslowiella iniecta]KOC94176.1 iron-regulated protein [Winslowiella iniecta]